MSASSRHAREPDTSEVLLVERDLLDSDGKELRVLKRGVEVVQGGIFRELDRKGLLQTTDVNLQDRTCQSRRWCSGDCD